MFRDSRPTLMTSFIVRLHGLVLRGLKKSNGEQIIKEEKALIFIFYSAYVMGILLSSPLPKRRTVQFYFCKNVLIVLIVKCKTNKNQVWMAFQCSWHCISVFKYMKLHCIPYTVTFICIHNSLFTHPCVHPLNSVRPNGLFKALLG